MSQSLNNIDLSFLKKKHEDTDLRFKLQISIDHIPQEKPSQVNPLLIEYQNDLQIDPNTLKEKESQEKQDTKDTLIDIPDLTKDIEYDSRYFKDNPHILCFRCKKYGHISKICPDEFMDNQRVCYYCLSEDHVYANCTNILCFKCREVGHEAKDCPNPGFEYQILFRNVC